VTTGTLRFAPVTNIRLKWRTVAVFSASGPTMKPGVSHSDRTGSAYASHSCRKRAALSAASASMAPPRWAGLLASSPNGRPSTRISAVTIPGPTPTAAPAPSRCRPAASMTVRTA
jgi:hypothetical protein